MNSKNRKRIKNCSFILVIAIIMIIPLISAGFFEDVWSRLTGEAVKNVGVNISVGVIRITNVYNDTAGVKAIATTLNAGPNPTYLEINFTAYQGAGAIYLNHSTATVNVSKSGENLRENSTCQTLAVGAYYTNYTCNVTMWWYDGSGTWGISASVVDNFSVTGKNTSTNFSVASLVGFDMSPTNLTWGTIGAGATNQTSSNDHLILNNTGNQDIGISSSNISINATDLVGETDNGYSLFGSNFSVDYSTGGACVGAACTECAGSNMSTSHYANLTAGNLTAENYTALNAMPSGEKVNGTEELYFCLKIAGGDLITQAYSTKARGVWTIKI